MIILIKTIAEEKGGGEREKVGNGQSKEAGGGHEHQETIHLALFYKYHSFMCRQGHGTDG